MTDAVSPDVLAARARTQRLLDAANDVLGQLRTRQTELTSLIGRLEERAGPVDGQEERP